METQEIYNYRMIKITSPRSETAYGPTMREVKKLDGISRHAFNVTEEVKLVKLEAGRARTVCQAWKDLKPDERIMLVLRSKLEELREISYAFDELTKKREGKRINVAYEDSELLQWIFAVRPTIKIENVNDKLWVTDNWSRYGRMIVWLVYKLARKTKLKKTTWRCRLARPEDKNQTRS